MSKHTTQDDGREILQQRKYRLEKIESATNGRGNIYFPDGYLYYRDELFAFVELKTCSEEREKVSTSSRLNEAKINEYRKVFFVVDQYRNTADGPELTGLSYFLDPRHLEGWYQKQLKTIRCGTKTYAGQAHWDEAMSILQESGFDPDAYRKLQNMWYKKGSAQNDPAIRWNYITASGIKIDQSRPAEHLRELVAQSVDQYDLPDPNPKWIEEK